MFVYIISRGENYEGSSIIGVCKTLADAKAMIPSEFVEVQQCTTVRDIPITIFRDGSCDYFSIEKHKVS